MEQNPTPTVDDLLTPADLQDVTSLKKAQTRLKTRLTKKRNELKKLQENTEMHIPELNQLTQAIQGEIAVIEQALDRAKAKLAELNQATAEREVAEAEPEPEPQAPTTTETSVQSDDPRQLKGKQGPYRYDTISGDNEHTLKTYANGETETAPYTTGETKYILNNYIYGLATDPEYKSISEKTYYDPTTDRLWNAEKGWFTVDQLD